MCVCVCVCVCGGEREGGEKVGGGNNITLSEAKKLGQ